AVLRELEKQNRELRETKARLEESHKKFSGLYNKAPVAYLTVDREGSILEINKTGANMLGEVRDSLTGLPFLDFVAEECHDVFVLHHEQAYESGAKQTCELRLIRKDGSELYGHLESTGVNRRGTAHTDRLRTTISDITQRKRMEDALRESKLKNLAILNTIPDIIFIQDKDGVYIDYHARCFDSPTIAPKDFLGKRSAEILPASIAEPLDRLLKETLRTGQMQEHEYSMPIDNRLRSYETRMVRLGDDKVLSIVRDITRQKQAEKALQGAHNLLERRVGDRTREVEEINRELKEEIRQRKRMEKKKEKTQRMETIGTIASGVAHEVRNPLNSIQAIIAVLNQELGDHHEFQNCRVHINTQVERLSRLMKDLLELGKQDQAEFFRIESIPALCRSAIHLWEQSHESPPHKVVLTHAEKADEVDMVGDMGKMQQVFINLLDNAAQHSTEGSEIKIEIHPPTKKNIRIRVIDRGTGIKQEHLSQVFQPFFTKRHAGTGLGLSIVKNIIEHHSGDIKVRNNAPLPGCTIEICLPVVERKKKKVRAAGEADPPPTCVGSPLARPWSRIMLKRYPTLMVLQ
ncbi:MAG: PAS domain-containing protein, partial [bacterium]|nr:PAS domain-containing protein [bacterium]